ADLSVKSYSQTQSHTRPQFRQVKQQTVKTFSWAASVISSYGKDTYHYVGTDINIYECINFNEFADAYGAVMWPGALALCSFLENNRDMVNLEDKQVLELGSGTGLVAIVASLLGAKVTATDLPNFLGNLRANVMRNIRGRSRHIPQICPLTWSFDVGHIYPSHLHRFDFVLAADVVYHHHYLDELLATMSHFCHPRTTIIWANKLRIVTDIEFIEKFKKEMDLDENLTYLNLKFYCL
uniref:Si:ch73-244f7.3 n=1 Tax=Neogobius melanostomus TaxID=47308 RepID=A0A8C6TR90_9GOBI